MRVLQVIPYFAPAWQYGGPIHVVMGLSQRLANKGHEVTVATTTANGERELDIRDDSAIIHDGIEVHYFKRVRLERNLSFIPYLGETVGFFYSPGLKKFLAQNMHRFDVLHVHEFFCYPAVVAAKIADETAIPYVVHTHGMLDPVTLGRRKLKKLVYLNLIGKKLLNNASGLIAITDAERRDLTKLGIRSRITVIANGVATQNESKSIGAKSETHLDFKDTKVILYLGRIHPVKGLDLLVEAFGKIAAERDDVTLVIAGPDEIGYKDALIAKASALNLNGQLRFEGLVAGSQKHALMKRADIFALTSYSEGFSMAILEALSYGKPVVITDKCYFDDVSRRRAGLVSPCDAGAIAENLGTLLKDATLRKQMGNNAISLIQEKYTWDIVADRTVQFYKDVVNRL